MRSFVSLVILVCAILGHLTVVRALINRGYELGLPQRVWQTLVALLVAIAVLGPIVILRNVGLRGAAVLRGGTWTEVPRAWTLYLAACAIALVVGIIVLIVRKRDERVLAQISAKSDVHDYAEVVSTTAAGNGAIGTLSRLPGNQIFTVEVIERELRVPRLPGAWDGLTILHITDLHMNGTPDRGFFEWATDRCAALKCDIATMTGDVMDTLNVLDWLPSTLGKIEAPLGRYFVLGNHDLHVGGDAMRGAMERIGWVSVAGRVVTREFREARLVVGGTEMPWAGVLPEMGEADSSSRRSKGQRQAARRGGTARPGAALWAAGEEGASDAVMMMTTTTTTTSSAPPEFRVLLSHAPHVIRWARQRHVDLVLAGHLHGGQIQWPIIGPIAGGRFHSGLFDLPPTLMHVGRGLGQMAPIRWGCRPEITKLVLRAGKQN
jgi:predicted MPP superfamily phosphohydrolase